MLRMQTNVRVGLKRANVIFMDKPRLDLIVDPILIQMLRIDTNVRVRFKWDLLMDVNVEDVHRLDLIVDPILIRMLRIDTNVRVGFKWVLFMDTNV